MVFILPAFANSQVLDSYNCAAYAESFQKFVTDLRVHSGPGKEKPGHQGEHREVFEASGLNPSGFVRRPQSIELNKEALEGYKNEITRTKDGIDRALGVAVQIEGFLDRDSNHSEHLFLQMGNSARNCLTNIDTALGTLSNQAQDMASVTGDNADGFGAPPEDTVEVSDEPYKLYDGVNAEDETSSAIIKEINQSAEMQACSQRFRNTETCCSSDPGSCVTEAAGGEKEAGALGSGIAQTAMTVATMGAAMSGKCSALSTLSKLTGGVNGAMAGLCYKKINSCSNACDQAATQFETRKEALYSKYCNNVLLDENTGETGFAPKCKQTVDIAVATRVDVARGSGNSCQRQVANAQLLQQQAVTSLFQSKQFDDCADATRATVNVDNPLGDGTGVDCTLPSNASNPLCNNCTGPNAANNPACSAAAGLNGLDNRGFNDGFDTSGAFNVGDTDSDDINSQDFLGGADPGTASQVRSVGGGGGGGAGLGSGGGGQGGGQAAQRGGAGGGKGYNANILKGLSRGGGYSNRVGRVGGSSGGYSNRVPGAAGSQKGKAFNLSKYLPGKEKGNRTRVAGRSALNRSIASRTTSIWTNLSNRVQALCNSRRLDCSARKTRVPGR